MCNCTGYLPRGRAARPAAPAVGERGMLLVEAVGRDRAPHLGPVTGAVYPFDRQATMYVDLRDAVYFLGPEMRLAE